MMQTVLRCLPVMTALAILVIVWQAAVMLFSVPVFVLPSPSAILKGVVQDFDVFAGSLAVTMTETVAGFAVGSAVGLMLAVVFTLLPPLGRTAMPVVVAISAVPTVAFVPLALIWFGVGMGSKIAMAALAVGFPVLINAQAGLQKPEESAINLLRSFGASRWAILTRLRLPAAMPSIVTGLRVGFARSTVVTIVTEMLGAYTGIGQTIYQATAQMDSVTVWAAVLVASLSSLLLYSILVAIDRRLVWWS